MSPNKNPPKVGGVTQADLGEEMGRVSPGWSLPEDFEGAVGKQAAGVRCQACLLSLGLTSALSDKGPWKVVLLPLGFQPPPLWPGSPGAQPRQLTPSGERGPSIQAACRPPPHRQGKHDPIRLLQEVPLAAW